MERAMETKTYSSIQFFKNCRRAYKLRYEDKLVLRRETEARSIGSAFHLGLEMGDAAPALELLDGYQVYSQEDQDKKDTMQATVLAMLNGWWARFGREVDAEEYYDEDEFCIPIINPATGAASKSFVLGGKVDRLIKREGQWHIEERKTASQIGRSYIDKLYLDTQVTTYVYGEEKSRDIEIAGITYRMVRKPSIRRSQKETQEQFVERLVADYQQRPDFYFFEEQLYRGREDLKEFEQELWDFTQDLLKCRREGLWYRNTSRCLDWGGCEYLPLCCHKPDAQDLYRVAEINPELSGEEED